MMSIALLPVITAFVLSAEIFHPTEFTAPGDWFIRSIKHSRAVSEKYYLGRLDKLDKREQRVIDAENYHRYLDHNFKSNREEDAAVEKFLGWQKGDFTYHNNRFYSRTGCTSWIIAPDISSTGACITQKNRDYTGQNLLSVRIFRSMPGRYKIITVNDLWSSGAGAVMNEKGLMIVQNDNGSFEKNPHKVNIGCIFILRYIAENCSTLDEAVAMLKKFYETTYARSCSIYLLADLNSGMIVEATPRHVSCGKVDFGFEVRANNFLLPGMRNVNKKSQKNFLNGANRRFNASNYLRAALEKNGKISPLELMGLSRLRDIEQEKAGFRQVCYKNTLASSMFVPDRQFPDVLSTAFVAVGPTRHTVFLPIPIGLSALPESLINGEWGRQALKLKEKIGLDHDRLKEFTALEEVFIKEFFETREKARILLVNNKRSEAVKLLDTLFRKQYKEAQNFISKLNSEK